MGTAVPFPTVRRGGLPVEVAEASDRALREPCGVDRSIAMPETITHPPSRGGTPGALGVPAAERWTGTAATA